MSEPGSPADATAGQAPQAGAGIRSPDLSDREFRGWGVLEKISGVFRREHLAEIDAMLDRLGCDPAK
jgi:hypothetical protein